MTEERTLLVLEVRSDGVRVVQGDLAKLGNTGDKVQNTFGQLKTLLGGLISARMISDVVRLADSYATMLNRVRVVTDSHKELRTAMLGIGKITRETRSSLEANMSMYARIAINTRDYGLSQREVLDFTKQLNEAIILSGVTAREAEWGMVQFSQGLASGALRGDELRAVLEQLPVVSDVISKHFGATRGELRMLGFQGKITTQAMVEAFRAASDDLTARFGKTIPTINQAMTVLRGSWQSFIGVMDQDLGVTRSIAAVLLTISDNMDIAGRAALIFGGIISGVLIVNLVKMLKIVQTLGPLLMASPWVTALVAAGAAAYILSDRIKELVSPTRDIEESAVGTDSAINRWNKSLADTLPTLNTILDRVRGINKESAAASAPAPYASADPSAPGGGKRQMTFAEATASLRAGPSVSVGPPSIAELGPGLIPGLVNDPVDVYLRMAVAAEKAKQQVAEIKLQPLTPEQSKLLEQINRPMEDFVSNLENAGVLLSRGEITLRQYSNYIDTIKEKAKGNEEALQIMVERGLIEPIQAARAQVNLINEDLKNNVDAMSGFKMGINDVFLSISDHASQARSTVTNAFQGMENAVVSLVTTGKADFKSMVDSMLADLTRLLMRMLMMKAAGGIFGSIAGALGGGATSVAGAGGGGSLIGAGSTSAANGIAAFGGLPGYAEGGGAYANTPIVTGEHGPELFVPNSPGTVVPNEELGAIGGGGSVTIINVSSMEEAYAAMRSTEGQRIIINTTGKGAR